MTFSGTGHPGKPNSVASIAGNLIVGGYRAPGPSTGTATGAVWTSSDGHSWTVTELTGTGGVAVASDGSHAVALGGDDGWISTDGRTWTPVPSSPPSFGGSVIGLPSGGFLASADRGAADTHCSVWFSPTGETWSRRSTGPVGGTCPTDLAVGPDGVVAVGSTFPTSNHGWISWSGDLGRSWRTVVASIGHPVTVVSALNGGFLAATSSFGAGQDLHGETWRSADGQAWRMVGTIPLRHSYSYTDLHSIVRFGTGYLAFGHSGIPDSTFAEARSSQTGSTWSSTPWGVERGDVELLDGVVWKSRVVVVGESDSASEGELNNVLAFIGTPR